MKAIVQDRYGSADVLELRDLETPVPTGDQVLIRVRAAAVNALDWHLMRGTPQFMRLSMGFRGPKLKARGVDVAGTVEAIGPDVQGLKVGDDVFGWCQGAFAEFACARENHFIVKPADVTFEQAASIPLAATTALQGLRDVGQVKAGQSVLINGASGGVGTFAIQIAKSMGAEVTAVCSTRNVDLVRSLGADHVIDYTTEDFTRSGTRYDVIFQLAGTDSPGTCRRALTPTGTLILSSGAGTLILDRLLKAVVLSKFVSQRLVVFGAEFTHEDLVAVRDLLVAGTIRPVIDRTYPLVQAPDAIRYVDAGHTQGKTVVTV
jgi:NADPH:quinone reductase-like Zn-dependent oxidoreductase